MICIITIIISIIIIIDCIYYHRDDGLSLLQSTMKQYTASLMELQTFHSVSAVRYRPPQHIETYIVLSYIVIHTHLFFCLTHHSNSPARTYI